MRRVAAAAARRRATRGEGEVPREALGEGARRNAGADWSACFDRRHCGPGDRRPTLAGLTRAPTHARLTGVNEVLEVDVERVVAVLRLNLVSSPVSVGACSAGVASA